MTLAQARRASRRAKRLASIARGDGDKTRKQRTFFRAKANEISLELAAKGKAHAPATVVRLGVALT